MACRARRVDGGRVVDGAVADAAAPREVEDDVAVLAAAVAHFYLAPVATGHALQQLYGLLLLVREAVGIGDGEGVSRLVVLARSAGFHGHAVGGEHTVLAVAADAEAQGVEALRGARASVLVAVDEPRLSPSGHYHVLAVQFQSVLLAPEADGDVYLLLKVHCFLFFALFLFVWPSCFGKRHPDGMPSVGQK